MDGEGGKKRQTPEPGGRGREKRWKRVEIMSVVNVDGRQEVNRKLRGRAALDIDSSVASPKRLAARPVFREHGYGQGMCLSIAVKVALSFIGPADHATLVSVVCLDFAHNVCCDSTRYVPDCDHSQHIPVRCNALHGSVMHHLFLIDERATLVGLHTKKE